jgi:cycloeucalenol cycloisomerase
LRWLAADPAKRHNERLVLAYSLVWMAVIAVVQATRAFTRWGDAGHLALGVGLALPLWIAPLAFPAPIDRGRPLAARHAARFTLAIGLFTLLQCYFGSALFFDVLGMEYHFNVRWIWNRTPVFLYFLTVAYFSTYYVVLSILWRAFRTRWPAAPSLLRLAVLALLGYAMAFAETASMANETLSQYFRYRDKSFVLTYGSIFYGAVFFFSLPLIFRIDEDAAEPPPSLGRVAWDMLACTMLILACDELFAAIARAR